MANIVVTSRHVALAYNGTLSSEPPSASPADVLACSPREFMQGLDLSFQKVRKQIVALQEMTRSFFVVASKACGVGRVKCDEWGASEWPKLLGKKEQLRSGDFFFSLSKVSHPRQRNQKPTHHTPLRVPTDCGEEEEEEEINLATTRPSYPRLSTTLFGIAATASSPASASASAPPIPHGPPCRA
ncbi:hypothetical protein L1887_60494 [Cichorium endivia]|nr:hypothetical protein L1887_60494 [Cichorium endivia]